MIVRDEEHLLARCLKSFRGAFDSILFVELAKYIEYPKRGIEICEQRLRGG